MVTYGKMAISPYITSRVYRVSNSHRAFGGLNREIHLPMRPVPKNRESPKLECHCIAGNELLAQWISAKPRSAWAIFVLCSIGHLLKIRPRVTRYQQLATVPAPPSPFRIFNLISVCKASFFR